MDNIKITAKAKALLKDFKQPSKTKLESGVGYKHRLDGDYEMLRLIRFIFSKILSIKVNDQPFEKINWIISFTYKDKYSCSASHEKFGFRIYVYNGKDENDAKILCEEIENILSKATVLITPIVESLAKESLSKGEIIVDNRFSELFRPYDYFRRMSITRKKSEQKRRTSTKQPKKIVPWGAFSNYRYYEEATYFYFFSLLEHLCVLFLAYRKIPERADVTKFTSLKWSEKFRLVFNINQPEFKKIYDDLIGLARYRRNPVAHGFSETVFNFYLKEARHKIACVISDKDVAMQWQKPEENFDVMTSFFTLLETHPSTKNIFKYLLNDFNVVFKQEALPNNDAIVKMSEEEIDAYIEYMIRSYDDAANMDW